MTGAPLILRCRGCGVKNRVPRDRLDQRPVCGRCGMPLETPGTGPIDVTDRTFSQEVLASPLVVLVDCWAPWCGPCRTMGPILDQLARDYAGRLKIAKINVDDNPATATRYGIESIPTMLLFHKGREVQRLIGALPRNRIEETFQPFL